METPTPDLAPRYLAFEVFKVGGPSSANQLATHMPLSLRGNCGTVRSMSQLRQMDADEIQHHILLHQTAQQDAGSGQGSYTLEICFSCVVIFGFVNMQIPL